jgi:hypothetical protein
MTAIVPGSTSSRPSDARVIRRLAIRIGCAVWLVYLVTASGTLGTGDAVAMFDEATSIIATHSMNVPATQSLEAWRGVDGRYYTPFGIGQAVYDIPVILAARAFVAVTGLHVGAADTVPKAAVALATTVPAAVAVAVGFLLAWRLSDDVGASVGVALVLAFGTLIWPYARFGFNAALTTAALTGGVYGIGAGALDGRARLLVAGGALLGFALLTRHEMILAATVALVWLAVAVRNRPRRWRLMAAASIGPLVSGVVWLVINVVRFGTPLATGHRPAFGGAGLVAFLVSPSGSIVLFSPAVLLAFGVLSPRCQRNVISLLLISVVTTMFVFYGTLADWLGTRSYGPRYLVPLVPLLVAPGAAWWAQSRRQTTRTALAVLCAVSVLVQIPAVAINFARAGIAAGQPPQSARRDVWQWSPLVLNTRAAVKDVPDNVRLLATGTQPTVVEDGGATLDDRVPFSLDFWWLYLYYLGVISRAGALVLAGTPLVLAVWLLRDVVAETRRLTNGREVTA